jgi:integrase
MRGNVTRRGKDSWRLKVELDRGADGARRYHRETVRGTKKAAEARMTELLGSLDKRTYVEPSKLTVAEHVRARVEQWEASGAIGAKTAERYRELLDNQIAPHIGKKVMQDLRPLDVEAWHTTLKTAGRKDGTGGVSARTIGHAHRVLSKALRDAAKNSMVARNVAGRDGQVAPRVDAEEIVIIPPAKLGELIDRLRGRALFPKVITSLFTGMRRGELLALRWASHVDLDGKLVKIREALEETKAQGVVFKRTKTSSGRRDLTLPDVVVDALREHRRQQLELRMALGLGKLPDDALVFPALDGGPASPRNLSGDWAEIADDLGMPDVTFHSLRHTHASQLIDAGVDIVTISKRLGHASPAITLRIYAHLFALRDDKASAAINAALAGLGQS